MSVWNLFEEITNNLTLDLRGLTVYTEAATGPYLFTPLLAVYAGAEVIALAAESEFGDPGTVRSETRQVAQEFGLDEGLTIVTEKRAPDVAVADIITNSRAIRPIDARMVGWMKSTAVIPLMWETWEFRPQDLDLAACRRKEILVLGTNETKWPLNMTSYMGPLAMKLVSRLRLDENQTRLLVLGGQQLLGAEIVRYLGQRGFSVTWFAGPDAPDGHRPYSELSSHWAMWGHQYDALIVAEHRDKSMVLGPGGYVSVETLKEVNPTIRIGIIAGNVDAAALDRAGVKYLPSSVRPPGYMSYQPYELGPKPVLELYGGGLKVGETMARARLAGKDVREAAIYAVEHSPGMDFSGEEAWI